MRSRYGNFHKSENTIGVELETTVLDAQTFEKPVEPDYKSAFLRYISKLTADIDSLTLKNRSQEEKFQLAKNVLNTFETALQANPASQESMKARETIAEISGISDFDGFVSTVYSRHLESGKEDGGLERAIQLIAHVKAHGYDVGMAANAMAEFSAWSLVARSYGAKSLYPLELVKPMLSENIRGHIKYEDSDAIEVISSPLTSVSEVRGQLLAVYQHLQSSLSEHDLKLLFAARPPDADTTGWLDFLEIGERQNNFGLHVHFGRAQNEFEAVAAYEAFCRTAPEIMALTANSSMILGDATTLASIRQYLYQNVIPEELHVSPDMSRKEKRELREHLSEYFGVDACLEAPEANFFDVVNDKLHGRLHFNPKGREYSVAFLRPELGTVEVRLMDMQSSYEDGSLDAHIDMNMYAVELVDAIGTAALMAFRDGKMLIENYEGVEDRFKRASELGLRDQEIRQRAGDVLAIVKPYLSNEAYAVLDQRVQKGQSPADTQRKLFSDSGRQVLYERITA